MHILVIEDDPVIGKSLRQGLLDAGHQCTWVKDGARGLEAGRSQQFDAGVGQLVPNRSRKLALLVAIQHTDFSQGTKVLA